MEIRRRHILTTTFTLVAEAVYQRKQDTLCIWDLGADSRFSGVHKLSSKNTHHSLLQLMSSWFQWQENKPHQNIFFWGETTVNDLQLYCVKHHKQFINQYKIYLKIGYVAIHSINKARCGLGPECGAVTTSFKSPLKNILMYKKGHTSASVQFPFINSKSTWRHV